MNETVIVMLTLDRGTLIRLWKSKDTVADIAVRIGVRKGEILKAWRRLKYVGDLPPGDRPRNHHNNFRGADGDGRPRDPGHMLDALRRAHKERDPDAR